MAKAMIEVLRGFTVSDALVNAAVEAEDGLSVAQGGGDAKTPTFGQMTICRQAAGSGARMTQANYSQSGNWALDCSARYLKEQHMPLLNVVVILIVIGVGLYLINRYIPMASSIKSILNVVVVVVVCVWLLQAVGLWGDVRNFRLTR